VNSPSSSKLLTNERIKGYAYITTINTTAGNKRIT